MIEAYSVNVQTSENSAIPFNNVSIQKGCSVVLSAPSTFQLNKCGIYMVSLDGSFDPDSAGLIKVQLYKNGVAQPQAVSQETGVVDSVSSLGFKTLVQVKENNSNCPCAAPTLVQIMNDGVSGNYNNVNVCITKIC